MKEAGVLLNTENEPMYWHAPAGRTVVSLPDSRDLWYQFWDYRDIIGGFAHVHPGSGIPYPSMEDLSTFEAIEAGLGKRLKWWITNSTDTVLVTWGTSTTGNGYFTKSVEEQPWRYALLQLSEEDYNAGYTADH